MKRGSGPESYLSVSCVLKKKIQARKRNPNESHFDYRSFLSSFSQIEQLRKSSKFEDEIRMEQEERKREEEEKAARREQFRQKAAIFGK